MLSLRHTTRIAKRSTHSALRVVKVRLKKNLGVLERPVIMVYRGYGNQQFLHVQGHVIEDRDIAEPLPDDSAFKNAKATLKRFMTDTFPEFELTLSLNGKRYAIHTNEAGYFDCYLPNPGLSEGWHRFEVAASDPYFESFHTPSTQSELLVPPSTDLGIISDIDDTFLISHSTKQLKKLRLMVFKNAHTRKAFDGVPSFYRKLHTCPVTQQKRPVFFISSSEWNLYDFLYEFCRKAGMPPAVLLLQDMKIRFSDLNEAGKGDHLHKLDKIRSVLLAYPERKFLLLGDSGQKDPELYYRAALEHSEQIATVYIRDVRKSKRERLYSYRQKFEALGIELFPFKETREAEQHAIQKGYIQQDRS